MAVTEPPFSLGARGATSDSVVIDQFIAAMREHQIDVDENIIADGKLHRYHVAGDKGRARNAWAILHIDEHPAGQFGCNKRYSGEKFTWTMHDTRSLTPDERRELRAIANARAAQRQAETEMHQAQAADRALVLYQQAQPVTEHPYLTLKGVPSSPKLRIGNWYWIDEETGEEIIVSNRALIVPLMDPAQRIHSLQAILDDDEGGFRKQYLKHGVKEGKFFAIGKPKDNVILICEGLATGLSLWQCTAHAVVVAFDAGNLKPVAHEARRIFPGHTILVCADNDAWTHTPINNPGTHFASIAASAINGLVVFPEFLNTDTKPTDFNDLHQLEGEEAVRQIIEHALAAAKDAAERARSERDADAVEPLEAREFVGESAMRRSPAAADGREELEAGAPIGDSSQRALARVEGPGISVPGETGTSGQVGGATGQPDGTPNGGETWVHRRSNVDDEPELLDTDIANAARLVACHGNDLRFTVEGGWMVWDGRRWASDTKDVQVQARAKKTARAIFDEIKDAPDRDSRMSHAKKSQSKRAVEAMIWLAKSEPGIACHLTDFDADPWLLNIANGTLDLRTGVLRPHQRGDLISNLIDIDYEPEAGCELWDEFLWRVTDRNEDLYKYLRRLVGYLLVGDTSEQCLHFLYGGGANGKSVFCEVIMRLLGEYAMTASPELIMLRRHGGIPNDVARLRGMRVALMNETTQGARFDEAKLKDLTGGDTLNARFLHQEFFDFQPTHRLLIRGNHKPTIDGTDDGIWRRLRLVPFTVTIPIGERDPRLLQKLVGELSGILNWTLQGCRDWQERGLDPPAIITEAVQSYREESDTLARFIAECCETRPNAEVKSSELYRRYRAFCEGSNERSVPSKDFPRELERRGFLWKRTNKGGQFVGLRLIIEDDGRANGWERAVG